jgi:hypothetical protein
MRRKIKLGFSVQRLEVDVLLPRKINNEFDYGFTSVINPEVEPTNNRRESIATTCGFKKDLWNTSKFISNFSVRA